MTQPWLLIVNRMASAANERASVFHQQHQVQRIGRRRVELEVGVERAGLIVRRVHKNRSHPDRVRGLHTAPDRITQHKAAQATALFAVTNWVA